MDEIRYYRTEAQARDLVPRAIDYLTTIESALPPGDFNIAYRTCFVGRSVPEEVGCVAVTIPGFVPSLTSLEFNLADDPEMYVDALIRYRKKVVAQYDDSSKR